MISTNSIISFVLLLSGLMSTYALGIIWWKRKPIPGIIALMVFLIGTLVWALTYAMHWTESTMAGKSFWLDMTYLGVLSTPTAQFIFVLQYLGRANWLKKKRILFLAIEPVVTFIILLTDRYHNLFYGGLRDPLQHQIYNGGVFFWINVGYSYSIIIISLFIMTMAVFRRTGLYQKQALMILIGLSIPVIGNLVTFVGLNPFNGLDLPPITFTFTGLFITFAILRYRLFDLVPIGRDVLVEHMQEGMLLVDTDQRLLDINPAAITLLRLNSESLLGKPIQQVVSSYPELLPLFSQQPNQTVELALHHSPIQYIEVKTEEVKDKHDGLIGMLLICRDITRQKKNEMNLREQYEEITALQVSLSEQAIRDPLTGLYNRRYLQETLPRELAQAKRENQILCVVMLDLDYFKKLNDTYGHPAGDEVLTQLGLHLQKNTRAGDVVVRFGGEEFLIVLPNTTLENALNRVEYWRTEFLAKKIQYEYIEMHSTFSCGISAYPNHGNMAEELITLADIALYQAKAAGRNCTMIYTPQL